MFVTLVVSVWIPKFDMLCLQEAQVLQAMSGNRAGLAMALQEKLDSLVGRSSGYIESLPMKIRDRVQALQTLQGEYDELEEKFQVCFPYTSFLVRTKPYIDATDQPFRRPFGSTDMRCLQNC